jgi:hypothetical protein
MRLDSDIDVLLVRRDDVDEEQWSRQVDDLVRSVTGWTGNDTRPLDYTVSQVDRAHDEPVLADVLSQGLTVAGHRSWLHDRLRSRKV